MYDCVFKVFRGDVKINVINELIDDASGLFSKPIEKTPFNAVIEGGFQDDFTSLHYILEQLNVPENAEVLTDGSYKYGLHGKTSDFKTVQPNCQEGGLEVKIADLNFSPTGILQRPRAVCMRDGRIFIDEHMKKDESYLANAVPKLLKFAEQTFKYKTIGEACKAYEKKK